MVGSAPEINWKTATNVWGTVSVMFDDAANCKDRSLRVIPANPATGVRPPDKGETTSKQFLYPSEFSKLVACEEVPLARRRLYAFAVYTYTRAGEIVPFSWHDVDLEHRVLHFHEAIDRIRDPEKTKSTKTKTPRRIPIEPELHPMLVDMHKAAGGEGRVFPKMPPPSGDTGLACILRRDLATADVTRAELHRKGISIKRMTFHDLRATGTTWMAVRGDDPLKIKQRAGHATFDTTEGYIRLAEELRPGFGDPFPPLPAALTADLEGLPDEKATKRPKGQTWAGISREIRGRNRI